jgi:DNA-binding NtrC family response regulator
MAKTAGTPPTPKNYSAPALRLPRHLGENLGENLLTFRSFGASLYFPMINKARVFVVDDEHIIADTFAMILNRSGFDAVALYNGPDAIALCRRKSCDVLLTDVMMEPINGIQTAIAIREICPTCKVLLFSGNPETARLLFESQAAGYDFEILAKPLHPSKVIQRVASVLAA